MNSACFSQVKPILVDSSKCGYYVNDTVPLPFSPVLSLEFGIMDSSKVIIEVHKILENKKNDHINSIPIRTLFNDLLSGGIYTINWDGLDNDGNLLSKTDKFIYYLKSVRISKCFVGKGYIKFEAKAKLTSPPL